MKERILIINNGLSGGGIERASTSMANAFDVSGYEVIVLALYKRDCFFSLNSSIDFIEPQINIKGRYLYALKMMAYVRHEVKRIKPDTILAFGEWTNSFVIIATRYLHIPLYLSDRMSPTLSLGFVQNSLRKIFYRFADGVIAQTGNARDIIIKKTKNNNVIVIPNPVNTIEKVDVETLNIITTVGRLTKEKGHRFLIEAFSQVEAKNWNLQIVGDGEERQYLEELVKNLGIQDRVIFVGHQKNIGFYLSKARIFVLPSLSEGFPNALIEAMSVPLACISSNCVAGPSDIIKDGENGLLVEPANSKALLTAMNRLIADEDLRNSLADSAYKVRQSLDFDTIKERYLDFILQ